MLKDFIKQYLQFIILVLSWVVVGAFAGPAIFVYAPLTFLLLKRKDMYVEIFIGFMIILVFSDSRLLFLKFAVDIKNIIVPLLALFLLFDSAEFKPYNRLILRFVPFFLVASFCIFYSDDPFISIQKTLSYFLLILIVGNYTPILIKKKGKEWLRAFVYILSLILILGFVLRVLSPIMVTLDGRYMGLLGNPNGLALFSVLFFMFWELLLDLYPSLFSRGEKRMVYLLVIVSIFYSGSRNSIFALLLFYLFKRAYRYSPFIGFIVFLFVIIMYELVFSNLPYIISSIGMQDYFRVETLETGSGRLIAWNFAWENIQKNFFIGKGFAYTEILFKKNYSVLSVMGHQGNAHNSFLTIWLDTGLIGAVLFYVALIMSFIQGAKRSLLSIPIMYSIFFLSTFESWMAASLNPFTIFLFLILTILCSDLYDEEKENMELNEAQDINSIFEKKN